MINHHENTRKILVNFSDHRISKSKDMGDRWVVILCHRREQEQGFTMICSPQASKSMVVFRKTYGTSPPFSGVFFGTTSFF